MTLSDNSTFLRTIVLQHFDKPNNKVNNQIDFENYQIEENKSSGCIDDLKILINIKNNIIIDLKFFGIGCVISISSTDILCDLLKNKNLIEAEILLENYNKMIAGNADIDEKLLDELIAFKNIYKQQNRINCAKIGSSSINKLIIKNKK